MPTAFQDKVYRTISRIPKGRVTTYKAVANAIGCGSARAVGQALRLNPFAPKVPCHRVIGSDLGLGGFQGQDSGPKLLKKIKLLRDEGIAFQKGKLTDPTRLLSRL